jgi:hypothetical protein
MEQVFAFDPTNAGETATPPWFSPKDGTKGGGAQGWTRTSVGMPWNDTTLGKQWAASHSGVAYDGVGWYRAEFMPDASMANRTQYLVANVSGTAAAWVNGLASPVFYAKTRGFNVTGKPRVMRHSSYVVAMHFECFRAATTQLDWCMTLGLALPLVSFPLQFQWKTSKEFVGFWDRRHRRSCSHRRSGPTACQSGIL